MAFVDELFTLLGYDTGVISGALVTIKSDLGPSVLSNGQKVRVDWVDSPGLM